MVETDADANNKTEMLKMLVIKKEKYKLKIYRIQKRINSIIIQEEKKRLKELMEDPSKSLFKYGLGGYSEEQERQNKIKEAIKSIGKLK